MSTPLRALFLALTIGCATPAPAPQGAKAPVQLTIVATNDLHGWVQPHEARLEDGRVLRVGGVARFASYVARLREENPGGVVLLDAGDLFQGTLVANLSEGEVVIAAYNALGYDAAAIGNHEFDYGPEGPKAVALDPGDDPLGALEARARQAHFPLLARNVYYAQTGQRPGFLHDGLAMVERQGVRIGIVGLLTPLTPQVTNPVNVQTLRFGPLVEEARSGAAELRARGAQVLIAVVHAGGCCNDASDPNVLAGCDPRGEIFELMDGLPQGTFDAVASGHTHTRLGHFVNGAPLLQSGAFGTQFGVMQLAIDPTTHKVLRDQTHVRTGITLCDSFVPGTEECDPKSPKPGALVPASFHGKQMAADPAIEAILAPYLARVAEEQRRPLHVTVPETLTRNYGGEGLLGNALADATRQMEKADVALYNPGGLRSDLPKGELTFGALYEVFPFDNTVATLTLTGDEIVRLFEALFSGGHGAPQVSGVRLKIVRCPNRTEVVDISFSDGRKFDRAATYKLTTSDFLALGGDGVGRVLDKVPPERKDLGHRRQLNMRDALADYLQKKGGKLEAKLDGRLIIDATGCK